MLCFCLACDCIYRDLSVVSCLYCHSPVLSAESVAHEQRCAATGFEAHLKANEARRITQAQVEEAQRKQKDEKEAKEAAAKKKEADAKEAALRAKEAREGKTSKPITSQPPAHRDAPHKQSAPVQQAPAPGPARHECPLCKASFVTVEKLMKHVEECVQ